MYAQLSILSKPENILSKDIFTLGLLVRISSLKQNRNSRRPPAMSPSPLPLFDIRNSSARLFRVPRL